MPHPNAGRHRPHLAVLSHSRAHFEKERKEFGLDRRFVPRYISQPFGLRGISAFFVAPSFITEGPPPNSRASDWATMLELIRQQGYAAEHTRDDFAEEYWAAREAGLFGSPSQ